MRGGTALRSALCAVLALLTQLGAAPAQDYPTRPVRLVVPVPAGGTVDAVARVLAEGLAIELGQTFVIDNRPGASGAIGAAAAAKAEPDGYTFLVGFSALTVLPIVQKSPGLDVRTDVEPVGTFARVPFALVAGAKTPFGSLSALVDHAKARPGELNYGSADVVTRLALEVLLERVGVTGRHVPYRGGAPLATDVASGVLDLGLTGLGAVTGLAQGGSIRILGLANERRAAQHPEAPTLQEIGIVDFPFEGWVGLFAPKGTSRAVIARVEGAVRRVALSESFAKRLEAIGADAAFGAGLDMAAKLEAEYASSARVASRLNLREN